MYFIILIMYLKNLTNAYFLHIWAIMKQGIIYVLC